MIMDMLHVVVILLSQFNDNCTTCCLILEVTNGNGGVVRKAVIKLSRFYVYRC